MSSPPSVSGTGCGRGGWRWITRRIRRWSSQVRGQVEDALAGVAAQPGTVAVVSGIDGQVIDGTVMDGGYWYRSLREPVQFHRAVQTLAAMGHRIFIEVSPHPVLTTAVEDALTETSTNILPPPSSPTGASSASAPSTSPTGCLLHRCLAPVRVRAPALVRQW